MPVPLRRTSSLGRESSFQDVAVECSVAAVRYESQKIIPVSLHSWHASVANAESVKPDTFKDEIERTVSGDSTKIACVSSKLERELHQVLPDYVPGNGPDTTFEQQSTNFKKLCGLSGDMGLDPVPEIISVDDTDPVDGTDSMDSISEKQLCSRESTADEQFEAITLRTPCQEEAGAFPVSAEDTTMQPSYEELPDKAVSQPEGMQAAGEVAVCLQRKFFSSTAYHTPKRQHRLSHIEHRLDGYQCRLENLEKRLHACRATEDHCCILLLRHDIMNLSAGLGELAADALERGCNRVPGAMELFEHVNEAVDHATDLLILADRGRTCPQTSPHESQSSRFLARCSPASDAARKAVLGILGCGGDCFSGLWVTKSRPVVRSP
eukprot:gnl/TRDRNA2_/TRDRNA2_171293_c1_seq1.p1 gnl/TRDRNA2_/TRDRNA2_171293_c1~~gnl/TRDRNA2_/TRDRNA2_171293_c1_seq1.p1  ORF type:complete len:394 (+),score=65.03 gnl/TRDRNA2_/TRDRNA2_171293_c1_seq1:43-1182(+)